MAGMESTEPLVSSLEGESVDLQNQEMSQDNEGEANSGGELMAGAFRRPST